MPEISIIICTLNEGESIAALIDETVQTFQASAFEIVVVDDDSKDQTQRVVLALAKDDPRIRLLARTGKSGLASAAIEGWNAARGRFLAIMDGDSQHDPKILLALLEKVRRGEAEIAVMSRYLDRGRSGLGRRREAMSRLATWATSLVLRTKLTDPMSGLFVMRREVFEAARPRLAGVGFKILVDVVASLPDPPRVAEIAGSLRRRTGGVSKLDMRVIVDLFGLLAEKATRGLIPARLTPFVLVGATGTVLHAIVLMLAHRVAELSFPVSQGLAIFGAMTWNYWLNNNLTFRDRRRRGVSFFTGALLFYAACLGGALISAVAATAMHRLDVHWLVAGLSGAVLGGLWNYAVARRTTWRSSLNMLGGVEELTPRAASDPLKSAARH